MGDTSGTDDGVRVGVGVGVGRGVAVAVAVEVAVAVGVAVGAVVGVSAGVGVSMGVGVGTAVCVGSGVGVHVGPGVQVGAGVHVGSGVNVHVGSGVHVGATAGVNDGLVHPVTIAHAATNAMAAARTKGRNPKAYAFQGRTRLSESRTPAIQVVQRAIRSACPVRAQVIQPVLMSFGINRPKPKGQRSGQCRPDPLHRTTQRTVPPSQLSDSVHAPRFQAPVHH